jgi:uncharacterized protein
VTVDISGLKDQLKADGLHLLFAAESGSRAWGFESPDSDYDVRFVFAREVSGYLVISDQIDAIAYQNGDLDVSGWDLRKALRLANKSNPALLEWLGSPITYADEYGFRENLLGIMQKHFSARALAHHYVNFAANTGGHINKVFEGEKTCKAYFYAIRPIMCITWMWQHPGLLPPVRLKDLLLSMILPHELLGEIKRLLRVKLETPEKHSYCSNYLNEFITQWFADHWEIPKEFEARSVPNELLDDLFAKTVMNLR